MNKPAAWPARRLVALGFVFWVLATVLFRVLGQQLLIPGDTLRTVLIFGATFPLMSALTSAVLRAHGLTGPARVVGGVLLLAPSLLLDGLLSVPFFGMVFPNMDQQVAPLFAGLMCVAYATGLLVSLSPAGASARMP